MDVSTFWHFLDLEYLDRFSERCSQLAFIIFKISNLQLLRLSIILRIIWLWGAIWLSYDFRIFWWFLFSSLRAAASGVSLIRSLILSLNQYLQEQRLVDSRVLEACYHCLGGQGLSSFRLFRNWALEKLKLRVIETLNNEK